MTVSLPDLRDRASTALQQLIPEVPGIVIALTSELPESHRGAGIAYTGKDLDVAIRAYSGFEGRAVALVVNDQVILENQTAHAIARNLAAATASMLRGAFLEAVAHEVGHIITNGWVPSADDPEPPSPTVTARVEKLCEGGPDRRSDSEEIAPWINHNGRWVRMYLQLSHRLRAVGFSITPQLDDFHGLSPAWKYATALGDEPIQLVDVPLPEIGNIAPPEPFRELWKSDVRRWWTNLSHPTEAQTDALFQALQMCVPIQ